MAPPLATVDDVGRITRAKGFELRTIEVDRGVIDIAVKDQAGNVATILADISRKGSTVTLSGFHVSQLGSGRGVLGREGINKVAQALGQHLEAKKIVIQGAERSHGLMGGRIPRPIEFEIE